jgi:DNA-binding SARP family transcriptional activator
MLTVTMLGRLSFSLDQMLVRSDLGPNGRLLASYLFAHPNRIHHRERLADLFWPDLDRDRARSALNTAIWRIRKLLSRSSVGCGERCLIAVGDDVLYEMSSSIRIDTHTLQTAAKHIISAPEVKLSDAVAHELRFAADCYGGPFLDGEEGEWILQERERLQCLYVRMLRHLMRDAVARGRFEDSLEYGRRILAIDVLRESVQRDVMFLLVLNGQRGDAIYTFRRLAQVLKAELGIGPMPETRGLAEDIISGAIFNDLEQRTRMHFTDPAYD